MLWVVSAVLQTFPVTAEDVSVTLPPEQKVRGPPAVMVGIVGNTQVPTVTEPL